MGFFDALSKVDMESILGQMLRGRIRDKFRTVETPLIHSNYL